MKLFKKIRNFLGRKLGVPCEDVNDLKKRGIKVGENVDIINSRIDNYTEIGNNVTITTATVLTHDGSTYKFLGKSKIGKVVIGNDVFIGLGSIILPGSIIGNKVIVGAGSVVSGKVEDNSVIVGNPAKKYVRLMSISQSTKTKWQKKTHLIFQ